MDDIAFRSDSGRFRLRGVGIILKDGKVLMVHDEKRKYYYAIGGAVHLGEMTSDAAVREVREESGLEVEIDRLVMVQENLFNMGFHHELAFYYLMKDIGEQEISSDRVQDFNEEGLAWLPVAELENYNVYPRIYRSLLKDIPEKVVHSQVDDRVSNLEFK